MDNNNKEKKIIVPIIDFNHFYDHKVVLNFLSMFTDIGQNFIFKDVLFLFMHDWTL